ncbi:MAG: cupin domain-containing protein [Chloroflexi bacterium]|nr:cupin domain-containing protein [Chloroflexota bacterium]
MLAVHIDEGRGIITPPPYTRDVRVLLSPLLQAELANTGIMVGYSEVAPGQQGSRHSHPHEAEVWMFFAGEGKATIGDEDVTIRPGSVIYTPPDTPHQFFNTGDETVKLFWFYSPPGAERGILEGLFR